VQRDPQHFRGLVPLQESFGFPSAMLFGGIVWVLQTSVRVGGGGQGDGEGELSLQGDPQHPLESGEDQIYGTAMDCFLEILELSVGSRLQSWDVLCLMLRVYSSHFSCKWIR